MSGMFFGTNQIKKIFYGNTEIKKVYNGNTEVWSGDDPFITLKSDTQFTVYHKPAAAGEINNGTLQYSTDKTSWTNWNVSSASSSSTTISSSASGYLYLRQLNGTKFGRTLQFENATNLEIIGDIRTLLNYENFANITICSNACFRNMFKSNTFLVNADKLKILFSVYENNSLFAMFYGCSNLITTPEMCDCQIKDNAVCQMFYNCSNIIKTPKNLRFTTITKSASYYPPCQSVFSGCTKLETVVPITVTSISTPSTTDFASMYYKCTSLKQVNALYVTNITNAVFGQMYNQSNIKVFSSSGSGHTKTWRLPYTGTATGTTAQNLMFYNTGGDVRDITPNTTYYIEDNIEIV